MDDKLLIVESPTKARTLERYLKGKGFTILSSNGHILDLARKSLSIDIENDFNPTYAVIKGKSKILKKIKDAAKTAESIYLATDPDREGEAISFHLAQKIGKKVVPYRILFYEITKESIEQALKEPGYINIHLVKSQQARRILDRLVGYLISPYLWKTVRRGLSAGRVQTVALRLIVEREEDIDRFETREYWTIEAKFRKRDDGQFPSSLARIEGKKPEIPSEKTADGIIAEVKKQTFKVSQYDKKKVSQTPPPPFITSNLQLEASSRYNFSTKQTMLIAQQLYEGIDIGEEGPVGLITYMRTDSFRISEKAQKEARQFITDRFGKDYVPETGRVYKSKKTAQDAHEAIRPTSAHRIPESLESYLDARQHKLYTLIWNRFLASQMADAEYETVTADLEGGPFLFRSSARKLLFDGFVRVLGQKKEEQTEIPPLEPGEHVDLISLDKTQHFTEPPKRYSEGSLVKQLEAKGIGRPSTYAPIISTIQDRGYVEKQARVLVPTELGKVVLKILVEYFGDIFNYDFTKEMELELDEIEDGKKDILAVLNDLYKPLKRMLNKVEKEVAKIKDRVEEKTETQCEQCGKPMVIKWGKYGRFLACTGYPDCRNTKQLEAEKVEGSCPQCGADLIIRRGKFGRFVSCVNYPQCQYSTSVSTGVPCPQKDCGGELVEKQTKKGKIFYGCSNYPACTFAVWDKPVPMQCPHCAHPFLLEKYGRRGVYFKCPSCRAKIEPEDQ
jgi:DNA topoisomerase-1